MRVTANMSAENSLYNIQQGRARLDRLQESISSGQNVNRPSDDPISSRLLLDIGDKLKTIDQHSLRVDGIINIGIHLISNSAVNRIKTARPRNSQRRAVYLAIKIFYQDKSLRIMIICMSCAITEYSRGTGILRMDI